MCGNVWEWCSDWLDVEYYQASPLHAPTGPPTGSLRVQCGGSFLCHASCCRRYRVSARFGNDPESSSSNVGEGSPPTPERAQTGISPNRVMDSDVAGAKVAQWQSPKRPRMRTKALLAISRGVSGARLARRPERLTPRPMPSGRHQRSRPDPVALLESQAASRVQELIPDRYGRMLVSPFTFTAGRH